MRFIEFEGWENCVRIANDSIELIASTDFGPRIMSASAVGSRNMLRVEETLKGKVWPHDEWVNYGGHRLWHAPEVAPRTYAPDNLPVSFEEDGDAFVFSQPVEPSTGIEKSLRIELAQNGAPAVKIDHILINRNCWEIELAPWAMSVVAPGGRVIIPQEPYKAHGEDGDFSPARPLILWRFTDMSDRRWTWGQHCIQLRPDASIDSPQKLGLFNSLGWAAYSAQNGDLMLVFIEPCPAAPAACADMGANFETFTKADFQELETLGALQKVAPGASASHVQKWVIFKGANLPDDDLALSEALNLLVREAERILNESF